MVSIVEALKPCPCCGSKAVFINKTFSLMIKVSCTRCGMRTCKVNSKEQARKTWNRRNG